MKKAVIYCRVSTEEQKKYGFSIKTQIQACQEFAIHEGYFIAQTYIEEGKSAKDLNRTEVQKMINEQYVRAKELLQSHQEGHAKLAQLLIDREVIFAEDVEKIFGKRPWASRSEEIMAIEEKSSANKQESDNTAIESKSDDEQKLLPDSTETDNNEKETTNKKNETQTQD